MKGESGSPFRMPRVGRKGTEGDPFSKTEKLGEVIRFVIDNFTGYQYCPSKVSF